MPTFQYLIITILSIHFLLGLVTKFLNLRAMSPYLPDEFKDTYDQEKYTQSQNYLKDNTRFSLISESFSFICTVIFLLFILKPLYQIINPWTANPILQAMFYLGSLALVSLILELPFSYYRTFIIEEKYGFNKTSLTTFILDRVKGLILGGIIGSLILGALLYFFINTGLWAWIYCWIFFFALQLILQYLIPTYILPLFNKFTPLPEGELRSEIETYSLQQKFELNGIFTMDGSKRSTKANAFFTGFGKMRRIVLFDTLIKNQTNHELVAILAHEMGHCQLKHIQKSLISSFFVSGLTFFFMSFILNSSVIYTDFGLTEPVIYLGLIFFSLLFSPLSLILSLLGNCKSRKHEFEADAYSAKTYGQPEALISALKKLSVDNLSNLTPHPLVVFLEYSHPPVLLRIEALRNKAS